MDKKILIWQALPAKEQIFRGGMSVCKNWGFTQTLMEHLETELEVELRQIDQTPMTLS